MKQPAGVFCYSAILLGAYWWCHSTSGFLAIWLGLSLAVDKYLLRWLPWENPISWSRELFVRGSYFAVGAAGFWLLRPGIVPWWEAVFLGTLISLIALVPECVLELAGRGKCRPRATVPNALFGWRRGLITRLTLFGIFVLISPVFIALHPIHTVPKRTPAAFGLAFEDVRFESSGGVKLAAWVVPHPQARGNVIFCHGHGRNRGHVAGLLPTLHDLRLNVLAFDFRGHGDSQGHTATFGLREVDDLVAAAAYVRRRFPGQSLFLVGVSYGAAISFQALPQLPEVRGVWSEGCFARFSDVVEAKLAPMPVWLRGSVESLYAGVARLDCGFCYPDLRPIEFLRSGNVPICFCHGEKDELAPFAQAQALFDTYPGPKSCYWVPGASHYNVRQKNKDEYLRRLREFLETQLAKPAGADSLASSNSR